MLTKFNTCTCTDSLRILLQLLPVLKLVPVLEVPILKLVGRLLNLVLVLEAPILKLVDQVLDLVRVLEVRVRNLDLVRMTRIMTRPPRRTMLKKSHLTEI